MDRLAGVSAMRLVVAENMTLPRVARLRFLGFDGTIVHGSVLIGVGTLRRIDLLKAQAARLNTIRDINRRQIVP